MGDRSSRQLGYYTDPANAEDIACELHRVYRHRTGDPEWEALPPEERETRIANVRHYLEALRAYQPHLWTGSPPYTRCALCGAAKGEKFKGRCQWT